MSADWTQTQPADDDQRRRLVALAAGLLILAAGIAYVTLRPDSTPSLAAPAEATVQASTSQAENATEEAVVDDEPAVATSGEPQTDEQVSSDDEAADSSTAQPQAASIPRAAVSAPDIVGLMNGRITFVADGAPASDVLVELLASDEAGVAGDSIEQLVTDSEGRYGFDVDDGCYIAVFTAPDGFEFPGVGATLTGPSVCVTADSPFTIGASLQVAG